ncbi:hypothetical protein PC117_g25207 [Phytophthora cactorum]|uniref:Uncharacterized protein n=1 Tax=Phytophthora cactorum TaxID=29920 RepID=A0A8T1AU49_9STRA|nr:hypothetical protein PC117_g25207 [Phytophthora cactorum]
MPPAVTPSSGLVASTGQSPLSSRSSGSGSSTSAESSRLPAPASRRAYVARLLSCSRPFPASSMAASRAPSSGRQAPRDSTMPMVITNVPTTVSTGSRPYLPVPPTALTSPPGRPLRISAATTRSVTAQLLENMDACDDAVSMLVIPRATRRSR